MLNPINRGVPSIGHRTITGVGQKTNTSIVPAQCDFFCPLSSLSRLPRILRRLFKSFKLTLPCSRCVTQTTPYCAQTQQPNLRYRSAHIMLRRSHKKSRAGCLECKRRHVKVGSHIPTFSGFIICDCPGMLMWSISATNSGRNVSFARFQNGTAATHHSPPGPRPSRAPTPPTPLARQQPTPRRHLDQMRPLPGLLPL
jgi:hypothetical protein